MTTVKMNKNAENTYNQIVNTLELLKSNNIINYFNIPEVIIDKVNDMQHITWNNTSGGRSVCGKSFLKIEQYLYILKTGAYQAIMEDNSIIRCSFNFEGSELLSQNLLWWPCPIIVDEDMVSELGLIETIECLIQDSAAEKCLRMRSPVRIDFDAGNDKEYHPRAHMHIQHHECRINTNEPICFNRFMKHILINYYPEMYIDFKHWDYLTYHFKNRNRHIEYFDKSKFYLG